MKLKLSLVFMFCVIGLSFAQITSRIVINGKISAPIGDDVEGVVVYNRSTNKGTITNDKGIFKISAGIDDRIEVVAMQFQKFVIVVDKGVLDSKSLNIFLNESVNLLDEVIVTPYDLLGNVSVDVKRIGVTPGGISQVANQTAARINDADYDFRPDELSSLENNAFLEDRMINGLNFVNLFKLVYNNKGKSKRNKKVKDIDVKVRNMYNDKFFKDYLALEMDQINDFIFFAEDNGLNNAYFETGKELDLLQFLFFQSKLYRQQ
ncbi:carboxypeptidase-like regulatory domain-containing protein [Aquimarina sp. 2201CG5-10]|uniref:carboxypeptidase-like regulatory domain-containing protein n=1 Tax=Aquimarina callyspongiae TaxID=3098150 RepID=UPI002AB442E1|nr:carboxypeptidase-like regulatory domain-containing protein [Aquimarina sp. 2201CG5-10]MDY8138632.1 hypothetical protein [Aquimarina sp. 2201CG5-10]